MRWADKLRGVIWYAGTELSQAELIKRAFAGDDVQADFEAAKAAEVEEELPQQVTHPCSHLTSHHCQTHLPESSFSFARKDQLLT